MLVNQIKLNNYRNYSNSEFRFNPNLNIIVGKNGIGKTNILESIVIASNAKSFRTNKDNELIKKNTEYLKLEVEAEGNVYKIVIDKDSKHLFINEKLVKKSSEFIGKVNAVLFKPSDLELFSSSPKERRKLLDIEIGKISNTYLDNLLEYSKLLKEKNINLKNKLYDDVYLDLINEKMIPIMVCIIKYRDDFFLNINKWIGTIYKTISNTDDEIKVVYKKFANVNEVADTLRASKQKDKFYGFSSVGIHREDYFFTFNDYDLNSIASQGQKRMAFIAFKFALIKYIQEKIKDMPIILLDDVLSELDLDNRNRLLKFLPKDAQIIITDTCIDGIDIVGGYNLIELKEEIYG